jgi:hypothetical protein
VAAKLGSMPPSFDQTLYETSELGVHFDNQNVHGAYFHPSRRPVTMQRSSFLAGIAGEILQSMCPRKLEAQFPDITAKI